MNKELTDEQMTEIVHNFRKRLLNKLESLIEKEKVIPINIILDLLHITFEEMLLVFLSTNYKDPIECAQNYFRIQKDLKESKAKILLHFLNSNEETFSEKFAEEGRRLCGESLSSTLNMSVSELDERMKEKSDTIN